jgi:hypothetical protein
MSSHESLGRSHFAQLYFQAAKVRQQELASFFARFPEGPESPMTPAQLQAAGEMASEVAEFLERASTYMNEAAHLGELRVAQQGSACDARETP